jgi:acetyltransferase-like isoleucine patch superfamily enzyme
VEHNVQVGNNSHIATGAVIAGDCIIGSEVFVGANSVVRNGVTIADLTVIGAGSVVAKSIVGAGIYIGNPARLKHS